MAEREATTTHKPFKSCVECRRRKIKCIYTKEDALTCRRCEERRVPCIPQVPSRNNARSGSSSKVRISHLEAEVKQLRNAVFAIQHQLGSEHGNSSWTTRQSPVGGHQYGVELDSKQGEDEDDSDDDASSRSSEIILQDRPSHLDSLFQNGLITTDAQRNIQMQHFRQERLIAQRLENARNALQPLIPTQEQVVFLGSHISSWLTLLHEMSPMTSLSASKEGIVASYPSMQKPDVDPHKLACWLLVLAIAAQQLHPQANPPETTGKSLRNTFPQAVQRAVGNHIISHDSLCGTLAGLETYLMFLRLSLMKGIIQKSWLGLRRVISIAELIGLPRASKRAQQQPGGMSSVDVQKASLWGAICSVERLAGTLMSLPISTRHELMVAHEPLIWNGRVNPATFWIRLGNVAVQLSDLDELASGSSGDSELYTQVLRLDNEMRLLAAETSRDWWSRPVTDEITSADIIKFQFHCVNMRIHLPFVVKSDAQDRFAFSRMAGVDACRSVVSAWCELRRIMPSGIFFSRPFDAQAFTASVVLLLDSYNSEIAVSADRSGTDALLDRMLQIMDQKAQDPIGYEYAQQASIALRSLTSLLNGDKDGSDEITAKIPTLGTITVRRRADKLSKSLHATTNPSARLNINSAVSAPDPLLSYPDALQSATDLQLSNEAEVPQFSSNSVDDAFSWVINPSDELLFQDNLMFEDMSTSQQWQDLY